MLQVLDRRQSGRTVGDKSRLMTSVQIAGLLVATCAITSIAATVVVVFAVMQLFAPR